ncbi:MAG: hypothetical protein IKN06_02660 [Bacteroidales bacterium]|nr:hypothetical protein [Bacteroidales bacterium]
MTALFRVLRILILSFVSFLAFACDKKADEGKEVEPEFIAESVDITDCMFKADLDLNGVSFQTGPEGTSIVCKPLSLTSSRFTFVFNHESGKPVSIEVDPLEFKGAEGHASFYCKTNLRIDRDGTKKESQATASGRIDIASKSSPDQVSGEILVTWNDDGYSNRFHITEFDFSRRLE